MRRTRVRFDCNDRLLLPEDRRYEILDGELYLVSAPSIRHQRISLKLTVALSQQLESRSLGQILEAPCDVVLSKDNIVQPDILFVRQERAGIIGELNIRGAPDLIIEILSASTRTKDLELKGRIYSRFGVQEYWTVDPDLAGVEVLIWSEMGYVSAGAAGATDRLSSPLLPELNLPLSEIFA